MVLPSFVKQAIRGDDLTVFGNGSQSRWFCHISDVVWAVDRLCQNETAYGQVFNIGTDHEVSILNLAKRVIEITGSGSKIQLVPYDEAYAPGFEDMPRRIPDLRKIKQLIGYEPKMSLEDTIRSVVDSYTNQQGG